jgi:hypothetical protein
MNKDNLFWEYISKILKMVKMDQCELVITNSKLVTHTLASPILVRLLYFVPARPLLAHCHHQFTVNNKKYFFVHLTGLI